MKMHAGPCQRRCYHQLQRFGLIGNPRIGRRSYLEAVRVSIERASKQIIKLPRSNCDEKTPCSHKLQHAHLGNIPNHVVETEDGARVNQPVRVVMDGIADNGIIMC